MTSFEKIKRIRSAQVGWSQLQRQLNELRSSLSMDGAEPVRRKIKEIVPEYSYRSSGHSTEGERNYLELPVRLNSVHIDAD